MFSRRLFLNGVATLSTGVLLKQHLSAAARKIVPMRIGEVVVDLNHLHKWDDSNGDTWDPFWADDGNLYAFNCDGRGFGSEQRNLAFNQLRGDTPQALAGLIVNTMDSYGIGSEKLSDNATWKACGQECIDSVFYAFVSRNTYGSDSGDPLNRQTAANSSLIKSTDRGLTWSRSETENYQDPMWPGRSFGAPFFIHYGQDGGSVTRDHANKYVYAISTDGFWNDGDNYLLGRVLRSEIEKLDASSWTFYCGGNGMEDAAWSNKVQDAKPILSRPAKCGQSPACYIPALGVYLMISWYNTERMEKWFEPNEMRYDFFQSPHPWGPWEYIHSVNDSFLSKGHMYGPSLCAKFQEQTAEGVTVSMFQSGCPFEDVSAGLYKMWQVPLLLRTQAPGKTVVITADNTCLKYVGAWIVEGPSRRATTEKGAEVELLFEGEGIEFIASKATGMGAVDIYVDGVLVSHEDLGLRNMPALNGITAYRGNGYRAGKHSIRVVSCDSRRIAVEGFRIIGATNQLA